MVVFTTTSVYNPHKINFTKNKKTMIFLTPQITIALIAVIITLSALTLILWLVDRRYKKQAEEEDDRINELLRFPDTTEEYEKYFRHIEK